MQVKVLRFPLVAAAVIAMVGLAIVDSMVSEPVLRGTSLSQEMISVAPGTEAKGGVWYCSDGTSLPGEFAEHSLVVANPSLEVITAQVTVFAASELTAVLHDPVAVLLQIAPRSESFLNLSHVLQAQYTAALVEVNSGVAVVTQRVQGPTGFDVVPCATRSSRSWYFPAGSTRRDARLVFSLFNPFPTRAVAQFSFATDEGVREPQTLRGVLVPAQSLVVVDVTDDLPRFDSVATSINLLAGQIVAGRLQLFDGRDGLEGLTAGPGVPRTHTQWVFTNGSNATGITGHLMLYNPNEQEALLDIAIRFDGLGTASVHPPFEVTVPALQRVALLFDTQSNYPMPEAPYVYNMAALRPYDGGFWVEVLAYNEVPIAAERVGAATAVASPAGIATAAGAVAQASHYIIAGNRADDTSVELVVVNPSSDSIALITVSSLAGGELAPVEQLISQEVAPWGRVVVPVAELIRSEAFGMVVESSLPVVVSKSLLALSGTGLSSAAAVPYDPEPL